jgi:hypothetical protein
LRDVSDRTLETIDCLPYGEDATDELRARWRRLLRLAALFSERNGSECVEILSAMRFSKQDGVMVSTMVERWNAVEGVMREKMLQSSPDDGEVRRWVARMGRLEVRSVMRLAAARWQVDRQRGTAAPSARAVHSTYRRLLRSAFRDPVELRDLAVDGDDLRRAGIPAGPGLGKILNLLLERVVEDPSRNQPDWLLTEAARLHELGTGA